MGTVLRAGLGVAAALAVLAGAVAAVGPSGDEPPAPPPRTDAVLYGIGLSTDPYGTSRPRGVGVAFGMQGGRPRTSVLRGRGLRNETWVDDGRAIAVDFPGHMPRHRTVQVGRVAVTAGGAPVARRALTPLWSPDGRWIAHLRAVPCRPPVARQPCYRAGRRTFVVDARRPSSRPAAVPGQAMAWTPAGRLVMARGANFEAVERSGDGRATLVSGAEVARRAGARPGRFASAPIWSPDGRHLAAIAYLRQPRALTRRRVGTVVVASGDGRVVERVFHSPYVISMIAWAPVGHRLAWTTSGFPDPHELFVADLDRRFPPRRLLSTGRHFDWVTWSPDGRRLLVDDENDDSWRLVSAVGLARSRALERLGGRPQWCCPQNAFATGDGGWSNGVR